MKAAGNFSNVLTNNCLIRFSSFFKLLFFHLNNQETIFKFLASAFAGFDRSEYIHLERYFFVCIKVFEVEEYLISKRLCC